MKLLYLLTSFSLTVGPTLATWAQDRAPVSEDVSADPAQDTFPVDVKFRTQTTYEDGAPAAPGLVLEIGVGHKGDPQQHIDRPVLARVTSDEDGFVRTTIDVPREWKNDPSAWVWARVETSGFVRRSVIRTLRPGLDTKLTKIAAYRGGTLFGAAHFADGRPAEKARVWLFRRGESGKDELVQSTRAGAGGRFSLNFGDPGSHVLHVRAGGPGPASGSGRSETLELDVSTRPRSVDIEVGGGAVLTGRVFDPQGAPVPGARILAVPAGTAACPDKATCFRLELEGGLCGGLALSDRSGRFVFHALAPGAYDFYGAWTDRDGDVLKIRANRLGELLGTHAMGGDSSSIELVFQAHRIEVVVLDANGETPDFFRRDENGKARRGKLLLELAEDEKQEPFDWFWARSPIAVEGLAVFPVEPDRDYVLSWTEPGVPYWDRRVSVPWSRCLTRVDMQVGERTTPCELTVRILDPYGKVCVGKPRACILAAETRHELESSFVAGLPAGNLVKGSTWSVELPAGRFVVRATAEPLLGCVISLPLPRAQHAPSEVTFELRPGEQRTVEVRLQAAGHLDFEALEDPKGPAAEDYPRFFDPQHSNHVRLDLARSKFGGGFVTMVSATGERLRGFRFEVPRSPGLDLDWIVPGWSSRCLTPIPPGRWRLSVEGDEGTLFEKEVVIEEGQVTVVKW